MLADQTPQTAAVRRTAAILGVGYEGAPQSRSDVVFLWDTTESVGAGSVGKLTTGGVGSMIRALWEAWHA